MTDHPSGPTVWRDEPREKLQAFDCVSNTYCVNEKDPRQGYERRWKLNVMWSDGTLTKFDGHDDAGSEGVYRTAIREAHWRNVNTPHYEPPEDL